jgi:hypothetical protein
MEEMKKALVEGEANSPIKATAKSVLPGVHQQFTNLHNEIIKSQGRGQRRGDADEAAIPGLCSGPKRGYAYDIG